MANTRKSMRKIRQVLRLAWESGLVKRQIARSLSMSPTTVGEYLRRATTARLTWPLPEALDDRELEAKLFASLPKVERESRPMPDWPEVRKELGPGYGILPDFWEAPWPTRGSPCARSVKF